MAYKRKYITDEIYEIRGKTPNNISFLEYGSNISPIRIVSQNKCVFKIHSGEGADYGSVKTLGCYKSTAQSNKVAKEKALRTIYSEMC